jgi:branched-chain amino acid transport system ATP-binding protein
VLENARLAAEAAIGGTMRIYRRASGFRAAVERARVALERVGLTGREQVPAGALAHGDKRKLELAMVLAGEPRVIMLDEPMAGISADEVPALVGLIKRVQQEDKKTVLMVEHHISVITDVAERIAVMHQGQLLAIDTTDSILRNEQVQAAYLGEPL